MATGTKDTPAAGTFVSLFPTPPCKYWHHAGDAEAATNTRRRRHRRHGRHRGEILDHRASGVTLGSNASLVITYSSAVVALAMMTAFLWVAVNFNKRGSGYSRYSRSRNRRDTNDKGELDSSGDGSHVLITLFNAVVLVASNVL